MHQIYIEKLVFGGQGLGRLDGRVVFVWNALPGEMVEIEVIKNKKTHLEAIATRVISPISYRLSPKEQHFLACSPWQILSFEEENRWKVEMARETYEKIGQSAQCSVLSTQFANLEMVTDAERQYGYRNKMEYSFTEDIQGYIALAFFDRGEKYRRSNHGCVLADPAINDTANRILVWINEQKIPNRSLKALILRSAPQPSPPARGGAHPDHSREAGVVGATNVTAALFIKDRLAFETYPTLDETIKGFEIFYSTHKSPASVPTALLYHTGDDAITASILGTPLQYGIFSFFQINIPIFETALTDIASFVPESASLIDYYSGVGSISLPLAKKCKNLLLIESNREAVDFANKNIVNNRIGNAEARCLPAEHAIDPITSEHTVILDPPRAGLHTDVVRALLEKKPQRIIYLSCNLSTHARDIALLSPQYHLSSLKLYNFFPRTPHIEGLAVLDKRSET